MRGVARSLAGSEANLSAEVFAPDLLALDRMPTAICLIFSVAYASDRWLPLPSSAALTEMRDLGLIYLGLAARHHDDGVRERHERIYESSTSCSTSSPEEGA